MPPPSQPTPFSPDPELASSQALAQLRSEVLALTSRVQSLEARIGNAPASPKLNTAREPRLESNLGLTLINRIGALTLAIGIIFFFKYAADNRWIGAEMRVAIGVIAGLAILAAAEWQRRRDLLPGRGTIESVFTQGLAGCGLAVLYVALYAAVGFYELIVPFAGWALLVLVSALAVLLSIRYASAAIAALGFSGALLAIVLLGNTATASVV